MGLARNSQRFSCDVLVIGGGGAGLRSAIEAREKGARVIVVSKAKVGYGNNTIMSKAILTSPGWGDSSDNPQVYLQDTVNGGRYINDQKLVSVLAEEAGRQPSVLEKYGASFSKTDNKFDLLAIPGHTYARDLQGKNNKGTDYMMPLISYAKQTGVEFVDRVFITRLFASNNRIAPVTGITEEGDFVVFEVKCVILATGGYSQIYFNSSNTPGINGDGLALAYELGIPLKDMEFVQYYPTASGKRGNNLLLYEGFLFNGAVLKNANNENILTKHGLTYPKTITRDLLAQTIFKEIRDGLAIDNGLIMDLSAVSDDRLDQLKPMLPKGAFEKRKCIVAPTTHHSMGGVLIDSTTRTALPGLYAAGEVCAGMHGANRLAGNALAEIFAMGGIAGRNAAINAKESNISSVPEDQIEKEREGLESLFSQAGENPISLIKSLKKMMWLRAGIVRNPQDLEKALAQIEDLRSESQKCKIETPKDLMNSIGLQNMLLLSEMVCRSALLRTESRGSHCRSDYPLEDNVNWLKNIVIRKENDEMMIDMHPVQLEYVSPA
ncbi:MAG: FAD-binding protein [Desulforhopalus sp.]|nr:FAD-binding protein [Desulforhopalus sp.]